MIRQEIMLKRGELEREGENPTTDQDKKYGSLLDFTNP
jgi:hypothetical protein